MPAKRRRWKLIATLALMAALFLCVCGTVSLTLLRGDRSVAVWLGNSVYILANKEFLDHISLFDIADGDIAYSDDIILMGAPSSALLTTCFADAPILELGDIELTVVQCRP